MDLSKDNFDSLFRKQLQETGFPVNEIDEDVQFYFPMILTHFSLAQLNCDLETYKSLVESAEESEYNLYNISFLLNAVAALRGKDLDLNPRDYVSLLEETQKMSDVWNSMVKPIRDTLMNKMEAKAKLHLPNKGKLVDPNSPLRRN